MSALPPDHAERLIRAVTALEGLATGDAFGQQFYGSAEAIRHRLDELQPPPGPWSWTDDTAMALSVFETLSAHGCIEQDDLAGRFAAAYARQPNRGYGEGAHRILSAIHHGVAWQEAARDAFGGAGSHGNGGAMRAAPIGAYFADDPRRAAVEALLSAEVTHAHPEGQAGAAAVAVVAALAWQEREAWPPADGANFLRRVADLIPLGEVRDGVLAAADLPADASTLGAVTLLGNGTRVSAADTVPFCLWVVAHHSDGFEVALWRTVAALGDRDTTCAIVGGVVALCRGRDDIPEGWLGAREALPW